MTMAILAIPKATIPLATTATPISALPTGTTPIVAIAP